MLLINATGGKANATRLAEGALVARIDPGVHFTNSLR
jgi:hypothetical protein